MTFTSFIAIYAATLSTLVFIWNFSRSKPKIDVTIVAHFDKDQNGVSVYIKNPSLHTTHVTDCGLKYPYRRITMSEKIKWVFEFKRIEKYIGWVITYDVLKDIETGLPTSIAPNTSHHFFIPEKVIREMLENSIEAKFSAYVVDQLWRTKSSKIFEMYPDTNIQT